MKLAGVAIPRSTSAQLPTSQAWPARLCRYRYSPYHRVRSRFASENLTWLSRSNCWWHVKWSGLPSVWGSPHWNRAEVINTLRLKQNSRHFADDISIFKLILLYENCWILFQIPLKFIPIGLINNKPALIQIMSWCQKGNTALSEPITRYCLSYGSLRNILAS